MTDSADHQESVAALRSRSNLGLPAEEWRELADVSVQSSSSHSDAEAELGAGTGPTEGDRSPLRGRVVAWLSGMMMFGVAILPVPNFTKATQDLRSTRGVPDEPGAPCIHNFATHIFRGTRS